MTYKVTVTSQNYKKNFLSSLMKLGISVGYKFLVENLNFRVNQCISGHVISQNMEFIRLAIFQPLFKDRDLYKIMHRSFHYSCVFLLTSTGLSRWINFEHCQEDNSSWFVRNKFKSNNK